METYALRRSRKMATLCRSGGRMRLRGAVSLSGSTVLSFKGWRSVTSFVLRAVFMKSSGSANLFGTLSRRLWTKTQQGGRPFVQSRIQISNGCF